MPGSKLWVRTSPDIHVWPVADLREHRLDRECWCEPRLLKDDTMIATVVTHRSLDGRELIEQWGLQ